MSYLSLVNSKHYRPEPSEVKAKAKEVGLISYSSIFAQDLACLAAGEKFRPLSEVISGLEEIKAKIAQKTFKGDFDGDYYTPGADWGSYTRNRDQKVKYEQEKVTQSAQNMRNYLQQISPQLDRIPGSTPLTRAMNLMKYLGDQSQAGSEAEDGDPPPFSTSPEKTQEMIEKLESALDLLENLDDDDHEFLGSDHDAEKAWLNMDEKIHEIMRVAQFCEGQAKLKVQPRSKLVRDNEGKFTFFRASRDFSDFPKTQRKILMSRNKIGHKILSQQAKVAERYTKETPLPFISMILDESGSMHEESDRKGLGILWYLVKEARKGNCIGLFSFFEKKCRQFHLLDQSTTIDWFKSISRHDFDGGSTRVGDCALEILAYQDKIVEEKGLNVDLSQKHLILVNDGQDPLGSFTEKSLGTSVLHSFILGSCNEVLKKISQATGGLYKENI